MRLAAGGMITSVRRLHALRRLKQFYLAAYFMMLMATRPKLSLKRAWSW